MKILAGILLVLTGIVLGVYVGFWLMFVGGIVTIVNAVKAEPVSAASIAWGTAKIMFAGLLGGLSFWVLAIPGLGLIVRRKTLKIKRQ